MTTVAQGVFTVGFYTLLVLLGFALVQRLAPLAVREPLNDVAGFIYAAVGVLYTVLLAFVVVIVWGHFETAGTTAQAEANEIAGIYGLAAQLPTPQRTAIQTDTRSYAQVVVDQEWPLMAVGQDSPEAWSQLQRLRLDVAAIQPQNAQQQDLAQQLLTEFHDLENNRRLRLLESKDGLPPILWVVLQLGGALTVSYAYLFGLKNVRAHGLMIAALTVTVVAILFMIQAIDLPFSGAVRVEPSAFEAAIQAFQGQ